MSLEVLYAAAHAEWPDTEPLGGGKAVADWLIRNWRRDPPFPLSVLSPRTLGLAGSQPLTALTEREYARFCRAFERASTRAILERDPARCVVLSNDISEGPDFAALGARGYRVVTIFHVDVVEYFARFYLHHLVPPHWLTRCGRLAWLPDLLRLVFTKQHDAVRHSARLVLPSPPMAAVLRRCYPWCPADRITVLPWGNVAPDQNGASADTPLSTGAGKNPGSPAPSLLHGIGGEEFVILTLSRLSPEKGIDRLLAALRILDGAGTSQPPVRLIIAGAPAYMNGQRYAAKLRRLAAPLRRVRVDFAGHVTGHAKAGLLARADLFVSPSRHESYGLAIAEAQAAGCRVLSHPHYGAQGRVVDCRQPQTLANALADEIAADRHPGPTSLAAPPGTAATRLAEVVREAGRR